MAQVRFYSPCAGLRFPIGKPRQAVNEANQAITIEPRWLQFSEFPGGVTNPEKGYTNHKFGMLTVDADDAEAIAAISARVDVMSEKEFLEIATPPHVRAKKLEEAHAALALENEKLKAMLAASQQAKAQPRPAA